MIEIPKQYDPRVAEAEHYARWEADGCFRPEANKDADARVYSIAIPPPNVTGSLHMGHALQHTLMDVLARYKRMSGFRTLWLPGTDHAGISTQLMVTRRLKQEGLTPQEIGRERFVERIWEWKREHGDRITKQMRREGASVDWSRERFTMDDALARAVREVFVRLYEEGFIYRGDRIVNWDVVAQTVLSDLEVEKKNQKGELVYLRYPVTGTGEHITVATTRPETMLGDTAVAVNPDDERYKSFIGKTLDLPLTDRKIKVIADSYVDPTFGTGAVKITPAHDFNDYEIGERHNLEQIVVIDKHGRMTPEAGAEFAGLDRMDARRKVVERFGELGLLDRVEPYEFAISLSERSKVPVEPLVMTQWFCRMDEMRDKALELMREKGLPRFTPENPNTKVYTEWLENLRDWTISRQLWWGHQIPAWYDAEGKTYVARDIDDARAQAGSDDLTQDPDVLDTWFSSALWSFSTLGFPDETEDLKTFHPTSVLVTARDILQLWVSRMVMTSLKFVGEEPFADVFVTGTIFDKQGQRMSKTKGNGVDPLDVFDKFGVDATRLVLANAGATDTRWNDAQIESYRNFANKIWNAARFCLMNSEGARVGYDFGANFERLPLHDRWCVTRLQRTAAKVEEALAGYQFHEAVYALYHFFWDDFCDWYIELAKQDVTAETDSPDRTEARSRALSILEQALRLLHPFMPFITEDLWRRLPGTLDDESLRHPAYREMPPTIMLAAYPRADERLISENSEREADLVIRLVTAVRSIRSELNIKPGEPLAVHIGAADRVDVFNHNADQIKRIARIADLRVADDLDAPQASARAVLSDNIRLAVPLEGVIDFDKERARLNREIEKLDAEATRGASQLANEQFVERAPVDKVEELRARVTDANARITAMRKMLDALA